MTGIVYDSAALIAAERDDRCLWLIHERALARGVEPVVPTAVLAESARPGMRNLRRLLAGCEVEPLGAESALVAGALRHATPGGTVIDAIVVESAVRRQAAVLTADRGDIEALAGTVKKPIAIIDI
ncbi:MAG TPA: hypothetical protein PLV68_01785 [Ilumatobacteraceae bacterium]|nr:hypothetical protein [Ilumatobacteraceae bacterium]